MPNLQDALHGAGLVSDRQHGESAANAQLRAEVAAAQRDQPAKERERLLEVLRTGTKAAQPDTFRREARKLLLLDPGLIQEVLNIAHARGMHEKQPQGGKRLIANLYQVKDGLRKERLLSDEAKVAIVNGLFSKK